MFLPLGDAMVIIFTTPLFTVILSLLCFRIKIGLWKAGLCAVLFAGMILNIQPPFIFPTETPEPGVEATLVSQMGSKLRIKIQADYYPRKNVSFPD